MRGIPLIHKKQPENQSKGFQAAFDAWYGQQKVFPNERSLNEEFGKFVHNRFLNTGKAA